MLISRLIIFKMINVSNFVEKIEIKFYVQYPFQENRTVYEIMWKNITEPDRRPMTIWHMRISCWTPKATNTLSEFAIFSLFHCSCFYSNAPHCYVICILPLLLHISIGEKSAELLKGICKLWLWNELYSDTFCGGSKCNRAQRDSEFFPDASLYINFNLNLIYFWLWTTCEPSDDICKSPNTLVYRQCPAFVSGRHIVRLYVLSAVSAGTGNTRMFEIRQLPLITMVLLAWVHGCERRIRVDTRYRFNHMNPELHPNNRPIKLQVLSLRNHNASPKLVKDV
jgi:hypothetical protein